jgi:20S proteasome alpha/beta subunit
MPISALAPSFRIPAHGCISCPRCRRGCSICHKCACYIDPKTRLPYLNPKPYTPEKNRAAGAMTIAVGFLCNNSESLVIAADRQFTAQGAFKYHAKKYITEQQGYLGISFAFAGDPGIFKEFSQKTLDFLDTQDDVSLDLFRQTVEGTINEMELRTPFGQPAPLYLLAGINEIFEKPKLIVFNGQGVFEAKADDGVCTVGCGDTSLIRYLGHYLYDPSMTETQGIALGSYLIKKATQFVDYCGEPIDVILGNGAGFEAVSAEKVKAAIEAIEQQEQYLPTLLIQKPFAL